MTVHDRISGQAGPRAAGGAAMVLGSMTSVQLSLALSADQFDRISPVGAAWLRMAWGGLLLLVLARPRRADFTRAGLRVCVVLGLVSAAMMTLFMLAVARIPLGTASALEFLGPLGVSLYGAGRGGPRRWSGVAAVGVVLLTRPWHGGTDLVGIALALGAGACWAGYILLTQRAGDEVDGLKGLAVSLTVAAIASTAVAGPAVTGALTPSLLVIGLGLAALAPLITFSLELLALRRLTASSFGTLMSLEPAIAMAMGAVLLGQVPGPTAAIGAACVIGAGIAAVRTGDRTAAAGPPSGPAAPVKTPRRFAVRPGRRRLATSQPPLDDGRAAAGRVSG